MLITLPLLQTRLTRSVVIEPAPESIVWKIQGSGRRSVNLKIVGMAGVPVYCIGLRTASPGPPRGDPQCPHPRCPLHALWPRTRMGAWLSVSPRHQ